MPTLDKLTRRLADGKLKVNVEGAVRARRPGSASLHQRKLGKDLVTV